MRLTPHETQLLCRSEDGSFESAREQDDCEDIKIAQLELKLQALSPGELLGVICDMKIQGLVLTTTDLHAGEEAHCH